MKTSTAAFHRSIALREEPLFLASQPTTNQRGTWGSPARQAIATIFIFCAVVLGLQLREAVWEKTQPIRYTGDIVNGFYWGSEVREEAHRQGVYFPESHNPQTMRQFLSGYLGLYDRVAGWYSDGTYQLDYPPLRLLVMSLWVKGVRDAHPEVEIGDAKYIAPLRAFNTACELAAAVAMFFLVRHWMVRNKSCEAGNSAVDEAEVQSRATRAGLIAALLLWCNPAMILISHGWPQWDVWLLPFFIFAALAASKGRWFWCGVLLSVGAMLKGQMLLIVPLFVLWPLFEGRFRAAMKTIVGFVTAIATVAAPWMVHGSFAWLKIGFCYGANHYPCMSIGADNLPALLDACGWHYGTSLGFVPLKAFLLLAYLIGLTLCAYAAASHTRRNDPRALLAITAPWLLMFSLLTQMHERYLLWGAAVSAVVVAVRGRLLFAHVLLSLIATAMPLRVMLTHATLPAPGVREFLNRSAAAGAWAVLICTLVYTCAALGVEPLAMIVRQIATGCRQWAGRFHTESATIRDATLLPRNP